MGKITDALKKAAEERVTHINKANRIKDHHSFVVRQMADSDVDPRIITYFDPKATISEQYKILRTNILSLNKGQPPKSMIITSANHAEGKTITTLNLAIAMAKAKRSMRIIVVDADMRKGRVTNYLGVDQEKGLSDVLLGTAKVEEAVFHLDDMENLTFMGSGQVPHNPVELVECQEMKDLLRLLKTQYDLILFDTPPIVPVTDAGLIGSMVDGVLMIIQAGKTQRGIVKRAEELLYQAHARVLGHVLTNIEYHLPEYIYRYL